jgi:nitrogen fixation/metabolism regulation signal transduction histidine kinase
MKNNRFCPTPEVFMKYTSPSFRASILHELVSRTLFVGIVVLFVFGASSYYISKKTFDSQLGDRILAIARLSAGQINSEWLPYMSGKGDLYKKYLEFLQEAKQQSQAKNLFILDLHGGVMVDANGEYAFKENNWLKLIDPQPFDDAAAGNPSVSILFPESDGEIYKIGYSPIYRDGKVIAVMGVEASAKFISRLNEFANILFHFGLFYLCFMGALLYVFGRRFISPIQEMAQASQKIAGGDFSQRVKVTSSNELGELAFAFNNMTQRLQSHNEYILESMSNGLLVIDLKGNVTTFNRAASQILEMPQEKAVGRPYETAFAGYPALLEAIRSVQQKQQTLENKEINLSEENPKFIRLRSALLLGEDSKVLGIEVLFTDETQLRKLQTQIKTSEKMATIGELAASISHEIRNPLGAMKGFAEILQGKLKQQPEAAEMVADIASEIEILNKIVTNFLIFARPTPLELQEVDLAEAVHGVLPIIQKEAEQKRIKVLVPVREGGPLLHLDLEQFRRGLLNLALNAIQASTKDSGITIDGRGFARSELVKFLEEKGFTEVTPTETEGYWAGIWVMDQGPGILPENLKKLFTPFFTTKTEGFGLGLSITKKILESMGGTVSAVNLPGKGAMFLMILPANEQNKEVVS